MRSKFQERIGFEGELEDISKAIIQDYQLGKLVSNQVVEMGYEDFNVILTTTKGKYFVKIFANFRDLSSCKRYVELMETVIDAGVKFPPLIKSSQGHLHILNLNGIILRLCLMDHISGKDFYTMKKLPTEKEIKLLAKQATIINSIPLQPHPFYDTWAIPNFLESFEKARAYLSNEDLKLIEPLIKEFNDIDIKSLPHCFVHGDIISTNVLKDKEDCLWIIDFSVSNMYPRIQELAVLSCNLLFDSRDAMQSEKMFNIALEEYQKNIKLTLTELEALPLFRRIAHAMHVVCPVYEKEVKNNHSAENEYWLLQGRTGLKQMIK